MLWLGIQCAGHSGTGYCTLVAAHDEVGSTVEKEEGGKEAEERGGEAGEDRGSTACATRRLSE